MAAADAVAEQMADIVNKLITDAATADAKNALLEGEGV